ncbi:hypothetical protein JCM10212_002332 [Sporobolomyces blumeae]
MLNRDSLLFSPTREGVPSSDDNFYASDVAAAQDALEAEARETLPFKFEECTYDLGYIRQPLYACLTCLNNGAVCAACSIACHADHELVELFNRRHFRCDCGTERLGAGSCCSISPRDDAPVNEENKYDANFHGQFCFCGQPYDPHTETDSMYQCLVCEDWVHHNCLFGTHSDDNAAPLDEDDFDMIICERCVRGNRGVRRIVERYAGRDETGVLIITEKDEVVGRVSVAKEAEDDAGDLGSDRDEVTSNEREGDRAEGFEQGSSAAVGEAERAPGELKRKAEAVDGESEAKKPKSEPDAASSTASTGAHLSNATTDLSVAGSSKNADGPDPCCAPPKIPSTETPLVKLERQGGRANVFLQDGWMDRWCRCTECSSMFYDFPYMVEEEEEYVPPEDADAHKSTFDLGMEHLLTKMPRAQALDSIRAFSGLSDRIKEYLRPLAEAGTSISKEHIESFFAAERERREGDASR